jgi:hypothetical protein
MTVVEFLRTTGAARPTTRSFDSIRWVRRAPRRCSPRCSAMAPLKRLIIEKTEGNPFFMEETVQVQLDEGALVREGAVARLTKPLGELKIPPTVRRFWRHASTV